MASVIEICNKALSLLGQKDIVSFDDDSPEAFACRLHWPLLRDEVLRGHNWNCVTGRARLNRLVDAPAFEFKYQYQLPANCLFVTQVSPEAEYEIEGRKLLTDAATVDIKFITAEEDSTVYDPQLSAAFSYLLAGELAPQMTSSNSESERLLKIGSDKLSDAKGSDGLEGRKRDKRPSKWIASKYG